MDIRKNLLDLHYHKYLNYLSITIIALFTYFIGLGIAFLTKQVQFSNFVHMFVIAEISVIVLGICIVLILNFRYHLKKIPEELKKL